MTARLTLRAAEDASGARVTAVAGWPGRRPLLADVVPVFERFGVRVADALALPDADGVAPSGT
jgi:glutamate dehydrogenase